MINRKATAIWKGTGKEGAGTISTQSTVLENTQYSFNTRFAEGKGTNPEELVAAHHRRVGGRADPDPAAPLRLRARSLTNSGCVGGL